jgi:hypothetical protein
MPLAVRIRCFASPKYGKGAPADGADGTVMTSIQSIRDVCPHVGEGASVSRREGRVVEWVGSHRLRVGVKSDYRVLEPP